jgi:uncharacterized protein (DUF3820 family)
MHPGQNQGFRELGRVEGRGKNAKGLSDVLGIWRRWVAKAGFPRGSMGRMLPDVKTLY